MPGELNVLPKMKQMAKGGKRMQEGLREKHKRF